VTIVISTGDAQKEIGMKNIITCLVVCVLSGATFADTWTVDDNGKADFDNIQAAVDAASNGDEIIVAPGVYTGTTNNVVNMLGKEIWLHSSQGAQVTFINGEGKRRGILCENNESSNSIIEGFTIHNCNSYSEKGGGMKNYFSSPTLRSCTFTNNTSGWQGGGMYNEFSNATMVDCIFDSNTSQYTGAGICSREDCSITIENCAFTNNTSNTGGGGMYFGGSTGTIIQCLFTNNIAEHGGGFSAGNSSVMLINCTFTDNTATAVLTSGGGAIGLGNGNTAILTNCILANNTSAEKGGGIFFSWYCTVALNNCTLTNNTASEGGGMFRSVHESNSSTLTDTTVCGNSPDQIVGDWIDNGGNTISDVCPPSEGACCTNDGCVISEQEDCITFLGQWQGEGTTCEDNPCPTSCLGDVTGDGQVDVSDILVVISVWGACP
jgi:hypothetical protein